MDRGSVCLEGISRCGPVGITTHSLEAISGCGSVGVFWREQWMWFSGCILEMIIDCSPVELTR